MFDLVLLHDLISFVGYSFIGVGVWLIGRKKIIGWPVKLIGDLMWLYLGLPCALGMWSVIVAESVFSTLDIYYWRKWRNERKQKTKATKL